MERFQATMRAFWMRILSRGRRQDDFDAELDSHLAMHIEDGTRAGLTSEEPGGRR